MPLLDGVIETSLYVDNLDRSAAFYRTVFGFETVSSNERLVALDVAGRQLLLLFKKGASADLPLSPHDGDGHLHLAFAIPTEALNDWEAWLAAHGVEVVETRAWERGGVSLYFRDPDGHMLEVATPGVWPRVY
jgi:catechol 2,3-dioxygenase-like lactoylglutathione lyase family enzyme